MDSIFVGAGMPDLAAPSGRVNASGVSVSRGWESAHTDRLNAAHWVGVSADHVNDDLQNDLLTLQQRSRHEALNNATIEGAIETHCTDVVGDRGPGLQMLTQDKRFNEVVEQLWADWAESCEYQHDLAMVDLLQGWVGQLWYNGEFIAQDIFDSDGQYIIDLGAERLEHYTTRSNVTLGIELTDLGRPSAYWIADPQSKNLRAKRVPASLITHGFRRRFAGQIRGIPVLASNLQNTADLRDFDVSVMDAARLAADQSIWLVTDSVEAKFAPLTREDTFALPRREARAAAPHWKPYAVPPTQPTAQYGEFKTEKERAIGRPAQMPLMIQRADSSKHNLSSARYDGIRYTRSVTRLQAWMERRALNRFLQRLIGSARLRGELRIDTPRMMYRWGWPKPPTNDPLKEAQAERTLLENGTLSFSEACSNRGNRSDTVMAQRARDNADLIAAGLTPIMGEIPGDPTPWIDDLAASATDPDNPPDEVDSPDETSPTDDSL